MVKQPKKRWCWLQISRTRRDGAYLHYQSGGQIAQTDRLTRVLGGALHHPYPPAKPYSLGEAPQNAEVNRQVHRWKLALGQSPVT